MTEDEMQDRDTRRQRTREAITDALIRLMFSRRYAAIRTTDLIQAADVGRSTFYEHFRSKDEVLVAVVEPILAPFARAAAGRGNTARLCAMLDHLWERRALARHLFEPPLLARLQRRLAAMIELLAEPHGDEVVPASLAARGAAAGQLVMLHTWLIGEVSCRPDALAKALVGVR
ncbi:TetR/AcrR family transcriptional regulator [Brevundimonas sp.]|uniref:TetR/AcrR family transcriptional regulator n=1 Tax=Brevundimonas sp. TaxID=1871086 RepID=UPI0017D544FE|nr:TetR/AcrR family transcriptional regulator [Brevundimonas sp.]MBA4808165.1 TetR/AcrR family transcriptional regulator [Brevundimonas sp.]